MTGGVAGQRRGRFLRAVVLCLCPGHRRRGRPVRARAGRDLSRGAKTFEMTKRKFEALRSFALFRAPGDKAVLRWGEPPGKTRSKGR